MVAELGGPVLELPGVGGDPGLALGQPQLAALELVAQPGQLDVSPLALDPVGSAGVTLLGGRRRRSGGGRPGRREPTDDDRHQDRQAQHHDTERDQSNGADGLLTHRRLLASPQVSGSPVASP